MRVALAVPLEAERRLTASADHYGHEVLLRCSGGDELAARLPQLPVELVIVAATPQHLTSALVETADVAGVRMLVVVDDADAARHASRLGILETVGGPADWALLAGDRPAPVEEEPVEPAPLPARRAATVVAVWGPHGAPGRTSTAIALAAEAATAGWRTVLADADTHAASVAPALGLLDEAPGFAAACRLAGIGGLDETQLERLAVVPRGARHPFRVLTGIGRPARWPELGAARVQAAITALRGLCEVLVVDVAASLERDDELASDVAAPRRNAVALEVLRAADRVVAVGAGDPVGIPRLLRGHAELVELVDPERVTVVVNKLRAAAVGVNPGGQVRQTLARFGGIDDPHLVPWDPAAFDAAVLGGRPVTDAAPRSAARVAIRALAASVLPATAVAPRRGLRRRSA